MNRYRSAALITWCLLLVGLLPGFGFIPCARAAVNAKRPPLTLSSPAFHNRNAMPRRFTADGRDISPPLTWHHVPAGTASLLIVMIDPDAPEPHPFLHWMVINIPSIASGLPQHLPLTRKIKNMPTVRQGKNSFGKTGYGGPAPPPGPDHHYRIILYALRHKLLYVPDCLPCLHHAIAGQVLAHAVLDVSYGRK